jgi:hypothetical protein
VAGSKARIVLAFNEYDFRHKKAMEILRSRPRNMTELVVNAVLHYVSCPEAGEEFNKEAIRKVVMEVITEMAAAGKLLLGSTSGSGQPQQLKPEDAGELSGLMDFFR